MRYATTIILALLASGCGSSPQPDFYLLTPNAAATTPAESDIVVGIGPVFVADFLERPQVVTHSGTNRLQVDDLHRWAEPLDAAITRIMVVNMAELLGTERVSVFPWRRDETPEIGIRIILIALDHRDDEAILGIRWLVVDVDSDVVVSQNLSRYSQRSSREPEDLVQSYSDLFAELAVDIAAEVRGIVGRDEESG